MRVEVRCCCNPALLLGWVELRGREHVREGDTIAFALNPEHDTSSAELLRPELPELLRLSVAFWWHNKLVIDQVEGGKINRESGLALKSNDTPIEKLRRIPGFEEAPGARSQGDMVSTGRSGGAA